MSVGLALGALALFWALMFPKPAAPGEEVALPLSGAIAGAGYAGLDRWLTAEHVPVMALRGRFDRLTQPGGPPSATGNLMITSVPHAVGVRVPEGERLDAWIRRGNTLLVMAALDDTPRWAAVAFGGPFVEQLKRLTRIKFSVIEPAKPGPADKVAAAAKAALAPPNVDVVPILTAHGPHPLFAGVHSLFTSSELPASRWKATPMDATPVLALARRKDTGDEAVWLKHLGKGTIIVNGFASPIANAALGQADNARWLSNVVAQSLGDGGRVIIDDGHSGMVDYYDPQAFFGDARLHHAIWWIVAVWFALAVGARHLRVADGGATRVDDAAMLRLTASFYASALSVPVAAMGLFEHFFNGIRRRLSMREDGYPVWEWLDGHARVPRATLADLKVLHDRASDGRGINLVRLQKLLSELAGHLA